MSALTLPPRSRNERVGLGLLGGLDLARAATFGVALTFAACGAGLAAGGRVLTPMDVVTIRIPTAPDLDITARIEPDGTIALPYLGQIKAAGLTEDELARRVERGLIDRKVIAAP